MVLCYLMIIFFNAIESGFDSTIFEMDRNYVLVDQENMFYVIVILLSLFMMLLEIILREGNMVMKKIHVTKTPLFVLKFLKLLLFYIPMHDTLFFMDLFFYKIPMHRKRVRLKCVSYFLLDALFVFQLLFL